MTIIPALGYARNKDAGKTSYDVPLTRPAYILNANLNPNDYSSQYEKAPQ